jgi:hypothetical protein
VGDQQYVAAGKAIIQIDDVIVPGCRPPIRFKDRQNPEANWPEHVTLGILRETEGAGFAIGLENCRAEAEFQLLVASRLVLISPPVMESASL